MARPSRQKFGSLDDFYTQQNAGYGMSGFERAQIPQAQATAARQGLGSVNPSFLGLSERGPAPSGRSSLDPEHLAEKELRVINKQLNQQLSPFNQVGGGRRPMPQQMANDSVFGAVQAGGQFAQPMPQGQMVRSGQTSLLPPIFTGTRRNSGREFVHSIARVMS